MLYLDRIKEFLRRKPRENAQKWFLRGLMKTREGKEEQALRDFNRAIRSTQVFHWDEKGELKEALKAFDNKLETDGNDHIVWRGKGELLNALEEHEEALECFNKALEIKPNDFRSRRNKGISLFALNKFEEAIESFDKAISLNPSDSFSLIEKGNILSTIGDHLGAIESYEKAIETKNLQKVDGENIRKQSGVIENQIDGRVKLNRKGSWKRANLIKEIISSGHPLFLGRNIKFLFLINPPLKSWRQPHWVKALRREIPPNLSEWYRDINVWFEYPTAPQGYDITPEGEKWMEISLECLNPLYEIALPYSYRFFAGLVSNYLESVEDAFSKFKINCKFYKFYFYRRNPYTEKAILKEKSTIPAPNLNKIIDEHRDDSIYQTIFTPKKS